MDILFVQPETADKTRNPVEQFLRNLKLNVHPSITFEQLAGITPDKHNVKLMDDRIEKINFNWDADIVGITSMTTEAPRAYQIADEFRRRGKTVVLGGWHPSALPEEAKQHADCVVIGESDYTWPQLLSDFENGTLKPFYREKKPVDISNLPSPYRKIKKHITFTAAVQPSRGCPNGCEFCSISNATYGRFYRKRKIDDLVKEIGSIKEKYIFFFDSSLTIDVDYTKKLFRALKKSNKKFKCFGNMDVLGNDDELLELARDAGCLMWFVGLESTSQKTINHIKKKNVVEKYSEIIKKIHDYDMFVFGSLIFGFDTDTIDTFDDTKNTVFNLDLDVVIFSLLTPYPGTPLFTRLEKEGRILTKDWSKYNENHVVFQPKNMTSEELLSETNRVRKEVNSFFGLGKRKMISKRVSSKLISKSFLSV